MEETHREVGKWAQDIALHRYRRLVCGITNLLWRVALRPALGLRENAAVASNSTPFGVGHAWLTVADSISHGVPAAEDGVTIVGRTVAGALNDDVQGDDIRGDRWFPRAKSRQTNVRVQEH